MAARFGVGMPRAGLTRRGPPQAGPSMSPSTAWGGAALFLALGYVLGTAG